MVRWTPPPSNQITRSWFTSLFGAALITLAISVLVLVAWQTQELLYASLSTDYVPMTMFSAISILLLSVTMFLRVHSPLAGASRPASISHRSSLVLFMSCWVLIEPSLGTGLNLEELPVPQP